MMGVSSQSKRNPTCGQECVKDEPGCHNFLVLGCNKHGSDSDKLEFDQRNDSITEESINEINGDPKSFWQHVISRVNLK
jgi:hypothetical protein